jgi:hypothetical protein
MQQHNTTMTTPSDPSKDASSTFRPVIQLFRILRESAGWLSTHAQKPAQGMLVAAKEFLRNLKQAIRHPAQGIFPPIGILSILVLTVLTVGVPTWATSRHLWPLEVFVILAIILGGYLYLTPREKYRTSFPDTFGWLPVTLGAASYGYWYWYASGEGIPGTDFFHAAAEVLPVILLAAVVDVPRAVDLKSKQLVLPIVAVFLGEIAALNVLAFGNAGANDFAAVASAFVTSIVALVLAVMAELASSADQEHDATQELHHPAQVVADAKEPARSAGDQSGASPRPKDDLSHGTVDCSAGFGRINQGQAATCCLEGRFALVLACNFPGQAQHGVSLVSAQ